MGEYIDFLYYVYIYIVTAFNTIDQGTRFLHAGDICTIFAVLLLLITMKIAMVGDAIPFGYMKML